MGGEMGVASSAPARWIVGLVDLWIDGLVQKWRGGSDRGERRDGVAEGWRDEWIGGLVGRWFRVVVSRFTWNAEAAKWL